ncbi:DUF1707 SHOCT-like domain-containing protein [Saccharopolyspora mangrovi]|uniref:DUF1707 domain-containing protein n=1 Tax=Saccharopolyspora mangrovi TaxID=3082379 RepID=A0ABU6A987_9PSEU|nr:DUF1707 domain-containing protein [Saccharopolyspora sp. S2-29]MEB3368124.1 DUF1707 domain-containing protein [Saccharopolyspora sp. S2-29]
MDSGRRGKDLRIGDPERERAMRLLGEHFSAGRLELAEYDERCRQAAAARFGSELDGLFDDLPGPLPSGELTPAATRNTPSPAKIAMAVGAVVALLALVLVARQIGLILLIPALAIIFFTWRRR